MSPLTVFDELVLHPLLGDLPMGWLQRLAVHGRRVVRPEGYRLCSSDGPADNFWLVRRRTARAEVLCRMLLGPRAQGLRPFAEHSRSAVLKRKDRHREVGDEGHRHAENATRSPTGGR